MLKGKVVNLRPMSSEDLEILYLWTTNQEYMGEYMHAEMHNKDTFIERMKNTLSSDKTFNIMIEDKQGKPIGMLNYNNSAASSVSIDFGIIIADVTNRGKGIGKESISLLIDYLFNTKNILRVQFMTRNDNEEMKSLGKKIGFTLEGVLRNYSFDHGEGRDLCIFGLTRDDWRKSHL